MSADYSGSNIQVLTPQQALRKNAGMYTHAGSPIGLFNELINNAIDEHLNGHGQQIEIWLSDDCRTFSVQDYGRGIPFDKDDNGIPAARKCFLEVHSGGKFNKDSYKTSGGLHGIGLSLCGILAESKVEITRAKAHFVEEYRYGSLVSSTETVENSPDGTKVTVCADPEIFEDTRLDPDELHNIIRDVSHLFPKCVFQFSHCGQDYIYQSSGLSEIIDLRIKSVQAKLGEKRKIERIGETVSFSQSTKIEDKDCGADIAFQFTNDWNFHIRTFVNGLYTPSGGTHEAALKKIFFSLLQKYFVDAEKYEYSLDDLYTGVYLVLHYQTGVTSFSSQTKEKFTGKVAYTEISACIEEKLVAWIKRNAETIKAVFILAQNRYLARKQSSKLAEAASKIKLNLSSKLKRGTIEGLTDCLSTNAEECELYLLEGDSAGGTAKEARFKKTQAILPLQGKVPNAYRKEEATLLANAEIKALLNGLGCGWGKSCDPNLCRYGKVLILTDADQDGGHIASLLIGFFLNYLKPLVERGMVYVVNGPLYCAIKVKERVYAYTLEELEDKLGKNLHQYRILRFKGWGETSAEMLRDIALNPETRVITQLQLTDQSYQICEEIMGSDSSFRKILLAED
jgi:DNA gyrase/topoisomerase IV subunit B